MSKSLYFQTCCVCGNNLYVQYQKVPDPISSVNFGLFKCVECGLGFTIPQPNNLMHYYNKDYYVNRHGFTQKFCVKRRIKIVIKATKNIGGNKLLDIGCGDGAFIRELSKLAWEVAGTEIQHTLDFKEGLVIKESVEEMYAYGPYDCITMWHSLEHMKDISTLLDQVKGILKPNGKLIVAVPNNRSIQSKVFRSKWLHLDVPRHLYHFQDSSLESFLRTKGFIIEELNYQEFEYDLFGWTQSTLNCIFSPPNIFFDYLRGKPRRKRKNIYLLNILVGVFLLMFFVPIVVIERLFNRSGTIIAIIIKDVK